MLGAGPAQAATALTLLVCCKTVAGADAALCGTEAGVILLAALVASAEVGKVSLLLAEGSRSTVHCSCSATRNAPALQGAVHEEQHVSPCRHLMLCVRSSM
jgi:hypothetical protein